MASTLNPNRAKIHRNYTVEEISELFGVSKNTVREWLKTGLPVCNSQKPMLILGSDLREFIKVKKNCNKKKCQPWELYCVRCRKPQFPADGMADYESETDSKGRLIALCPECEGIMNKFTSLSKLEALRPKLDISFPTAQKHINKRDEPALNSDFK
ncbi:MAG: helix-turn-helix domain-containing protein [Gammaproteobacteria bacterium]|jgi:transcription initiation factor IIE alpha subunit|nr:helix-turn-helix domain-containing protein [Gammaproteobacteria bacterium]MBT4076874.1 helix-turn-helix domain-containing protein [Gammaproteobacteria bacterium]MBT4195702.1 helix-turn-helix domain-containing protein [Gammaproteobacteria bacterium]MBT4448119.1 helix-turn-helix domain-containing protein [Gammaproteobacteria bacterium]MBT4860810.1 helix-turn-helix domain-containing protein [Gammaproteobacteria bacterium]